MIMNMQGKGGADEPDYWISNIGFSSGTKIQTGISRTYQNIIPNGRPTEENLDGIKWFKYPVSNATSTYNQYLRAPVNMYIVGNLPDGNYIASIQSVRSAYGGGATLSGEGEIDFTVANGRVTMNNAVWYNGSSTDYVATNTFLTSLTKY